MTASSTSERGSSWGEIFNSLSGATFAPLVTVSCPDAGPAWVATGPMVIEISAAIVGAFAADVLVADVMVADVLIADALVADTVIADA